MRPITVDSGLGKGIFLAFPALMLGCTETRTLVTVDDPSAVQIRANSFDDQQWVENTVVRGKSGVLTFAQSAEPLLGTDGIVRSDQEHVDLEANTPLALSYSGCREHGAKSCRAPGTFDLIIPWQDIVRVEQRTTFSRSFAVWLIVAGAMFGAASGFAFNNAATDSAHKNLFPGTAFLAAGTIALATGIYLLAAPATTRVLYTR